MYKLKLKVNLSNKQISPPEKTKLLDNWQHSTNTAQHFSLAKFLWNKVNIWDFVTKVIWKLFPNLRFEYNIKTKTHNHKNWDWDWDWGLGPSVPDTRGPNRVIKMKGISQQGRDWHWRWQTKHVDYLFSDLILILNNPLYSGTYV